jgi:ActR/RegA family two-component response regulator
MDSMLALLVADDPRRSADRILTRLIQIHQAQGGAILRPSAGQVEIWLSAGLSLGAVSELPVRWADHRETLVAGRPVLEPGYALLPAMLGEELVAALYLAQPLGHAVADARLFGTAIAQAVLAARQVKGPSRVQELSPTEEARLQLLSLLERHEWNIAEVARLLSVTRRTVYMRLRSFGIERKRVPKIYKKMPVEG